MGKMSSMMTTVTFIQILQALTLPFNLTTVEILIEAYGLGDHNLDTYPDETKQVLQLLLTTSWQVLYQNPGLPSLLNLEGITCDPIWCTTRCVTITMKNVTNWLNSLRPGIGPQGYTPITDTKNRSSLLRTKLSKGSDTFTSSTTVVGPAENVRAAASHGIPDLTLTAVLIARVRSRVQLGVAHLISL